MSKFTIKKTLLIIALALVSFSVSAQKTETTASQPKQFKGHIYVTTDLGASMLTGDVNKIKPGFDGRIGVGWQFIDWLSVKGNFSTGGLRGDRTDDNGFSIFKGNYIEANLGLNISFIDLVAGYNPNRVVSVTPHVGIGTFQYRLKTANADGTQTNVGIKANLNSDAGNVILGHGYKERRAVLEVPFGLELGFRLNKRWDIYLDYTATWTNSDLIDAHEMGKGNDWISTFNIGTKHRILRNQVSQRTKTYCSNWFIQLEAGGFYALGDVRKMPLWSDTKGNLNIGGGLMWGRCWKVYGKIGYAIFQQDVRDNDKPDVVLFTCDNGNQINANINIGFDVINAIIYKKDRLVSFYVHAGLGMIHYKSEGTYKYHHKNSPYYAGDKVYYGYKDSGDDLYHKSGKGLFGRRVVAEVPVGMELSFRLGDHWDIYGDGTVAFYDSDNVNAITSGTWEDWSLAANVGVRYKFNKNCPKVLPKEKPTPQIVKEPVVEEPVEPVAEEPVAEEPAVEETIPSELRLVSRDDDVVIRFDLSGSSLDLPENKQELADFLARIGDKTIVAVEITAFASPEGSDEFNNKLSLRRANAAIAFVEKELKENAKNAAFSVKGAGADWAGFMELLKRSNIKNKAEIEKELNDATINTRYHVLNAISTRQPEVKELYPTLRRAAIKVKVSDRE